MPMVTYNLIANNETPLYEQLYNGIRQDIASGTLKPGERLPSRRKLCTHLRVSAVTVEAAYEQLVAEGYIYALPKRGYFVGHAQGPAFVSAESGHPMVEQKRERLAHDMRTLFADTSHFPFSTWARMMREVLSEQATTLLVPTQAQGEWHLREEICRYLHDFRGIKAVPDQIVVGAGSEYLTGLLVQLLGRERLYALEEPGYYKLRSIYVNNGAHIAHVVVDADGLSPAALSCSGADTAHVTPSHQFPLGMAMPVERRLELLGWAEADASRILIEDDYDSEFRFTGRPIAAMQSLDAHGQVIYLNTFTKSLAPSLRISYMVLPKRLLPVFHERMRYYACTVPTFEQFTLQRFMQRGYLERHINRMRNIYKGRRDALIDAIEQNQLGECLPCSAGLHLLLEPNDERDACTLAQLARTAGVGVTPLTDYYAKTPPDSARKTLILGFAALDEAAIASAVQALKAAWQ